MSTIVLHGAGKVVTFDDFDIANATVQNKAVQDVVYIEERDRFYRTGSSPMYDKRTAIRFDATLSVESPTTPTSVSSGPVTVAKMVDGEMLADFTTYPPVWITVDSAVSSSSTNFASPVFYDSFGRGIMAQYVNRPGRGSAGCSGYVTVDGGVTWSNLISVSGRGQIPFPEVALVAHVDNRFVFADTTGFYLISSDTTSSTPLTWSLEYAGYENRPSSLTLGTSRVSRGVHKVGSVYVNDGSYFSYSINGPWQLLPSGGVPSGYSYIGLGVVGGAPVRLLRNRTITDGVATVYYQTVSGSMISAPILLFAVDVPPSSLGFGYNSVVAFNDFILVQFSGSTNLYSYSLDGGATWPNITENRKYLHYFKYENGKVKTYVGESMANKNKVYMSSDRFISPLVLNLEIEDHPVFSDVDGTNIHIETVDRTPVFTKVDNFVESSSNGRSWASNYSETVPCLRGEYFYLAGDKDRVVRFGTASLYRGWLESTNGNSFIKRGATFPNKFIDLLSPHTAKFRVESYFLSTTGPEFGPGFCRLRINDFVAAAGVPYSGVPGYPYTEFFVFNFNDATVELGDPKISNYCWYNFFTESFATSDGTKLIYTNNFRSKTIVDKHPVIKIESSPNTTLWGAEDFEIFLAQRDAAASPGEDDFLVYASEDGFSYADEYTMDLLIRNRVRPSTIVCPGAVIQAASMAVRYSEDGFEWNYIVIPHFSGTATINGVAAKVPPGGGESWKIGAI